MADVKVLADLIFHSAQDPMRLARYLIDNIGGEGVQGPKGATGAPGANGKDAPKITGLTINVTGTAISGQATMSEGAPIDVTGTFSQG